MERPLGSLGLQVAGDPGAPALPAQPRAPFDARPAARGDGVRGRVRAARPDPFAPGPRAPGPALPGTVCGRPVYEWGVHPGGQARRLTVCRASPSPPYSGERGWGEGAGF